MATKTWSARKVVIVGAGAVGATFAYALAQSGVAEEIAIVDSNEELVKGQVLDLVHGLPFFPTANIHEGSSKDYADASVIVITAGAKQQPGESRLDLLERNYNIIKSIATDILRTDSKAVIVMVTNPVDILTYLMEKELGHDRGGVVGSGTVLDSARFRYFLGQHCGIDSHSVHGYILGEHGDSEFAAWSKTTIGGSNIEEHCPTCRKCQNWHNERQLIETQVRTSAYHIIDYKGSTYFAIGLALTQIVTAILRNQRSVLTVSTMLKGQFGLEDVCLSVPCIVSEAGVEQILEVQLTSREQQALQNSAAILRASLNELINRG